MKIGLAAGIACVILAQPSYAQTAPASGPGALRRVAGSCQAETARLCPALSASAPSPRGQLICLRPYKSSVSFNCRSAVTAASRP